MFSTLRDLYYLAREAADVPVLLARSLGKGIALGWRTCNAQDTGTTIWRNALADAEAERDVWEPGCLNPVPQPCRILCPSCERAQTSPPDDVVSADSAGGERPASDSAIPPAADAGHPTSDLDRTLYAGAVGLRMWMRGEPCTAPTYFKSIAADLDTLSK